MKDTVWSKDDFSLWSQTQIHCLPFIIYDHIPVHCFVSKNIRLNPQSSFHVVNALSLMQQGLKCFGITVLFVIPWRCLTGSTAHSHTSDDDSSVLTSTKKQNISPPFSSFPLRSYINAVVFSSALHLWALLTNPTLFKKHVVKSNKKFDFTHS